MSPAQICIYCGSRDGNRPAYAKAAVDTGEMLGRNGWGLVYGAGDVGLMGRVARAAQAAKARTFGVIPTHLMQAEVGKRDLDNLVITETMHERKKVMFMNSDAVVVLPGGMGSLDEFFEVLTWRQLGLHAKPIILLDVADYWQPLVKLVENVVSEGFASPEHQGYFSTVADVETLETTLRRALS